MFLMWISTQKQSPAAPKEREMRREFRLSYTVSPGEREMIVTRAIAAGLPVAALTRNAVLGLPIPVKRSNIEAEAVAALNRIGSNLNQLARVGNVSGSLSSDQIRALAGLHKAAVNAVRKIRESIHE
ncbi:plasmid mobilization protein [Falsirhodobacter xinxiangensis]|uniref:plasmid mobilization protein n=1 Tax=Falsirhodobacter xinxiangensis TaxID=2530049 RepID=UPI0010AA4809